METLGAQDALAGNDDTAIKWNATLTCLKDFEEGLLSDGPAAFEGDNNTTTGPRRLDRERIKHTLANTGNPDLYVPEAGEDVLGALITRLSTESGPTAAFMTSKLEEVRDLFSWGSKVGGDPAAIQAYRDSGSIIALVDAVFDTKEASLYPVVTSLVSDVSSDKVGASFFRGQVYTNGGFYAANQVLFQGAVMAKDDGSSQAVNPDPDDLSLELQPGEIYLAAGSHITYVRDFVDRDTGTGGAGTGPVSIVSWIGP